MRVGLAGVDGDRLVEALDGFGVLAALLVDEPELILRFAVVGIDGSGVEHAAEVLSAAQSGAEIADFSAEIVVGVEKEERRRDPAEQVTQRSPEIDGGD